MKTYITLLIVLFISMTSFAQQGINYKALIKDDLGNVLNDTFMNVQFTIHQTTGTGTIVYQEDHNYTTDTNGLIVLNIGTDPSPTIGVFTSIDWSADLHFLQTSITYSGGTIDFDATQFRAVPYAKHAEFADNVFSGNYNDLYNRPTITQPGLWNIYEGTNYGWRLNGEFPSWHGDIGNNSVDLSIGVTGSETQGATGNNSFASGYNTTASANASTAMGYSTEASGNYSTAIGRNTIASNFDSLALGRYNVDVPTALFMIGDGGNYVNNELIRSNALTVLENGNVCIGGDEPSSLLEVAHQNGSPASESLSILNTDTDNSWQFHTTNYLNLYQNGIFKGSWNATSGAYVQASDRRVKKDITTLDSGTLNKVMQLNPVSYLMKDQKDTKRNLGLISQEVQELFPSITHYVESQDILSLSYTELIPILIKALQEQQAIIDTQNAKDITQDKYILKQGKSIEDLVVRLNLIESKSSN